MLTATETTKSRVETIRGTLNIEMPASDYRSIPIPGMDPARPTIG